MNVRHQVDALDAGELCATGAACWARRIAEEHPAQQLTASVSRAHPGRSLNETTRRTPRPEQLEEVS